jgi:hypothetical protein
MFFPTFSGVFKIPPLLHYTKSHVYTYSISSGIAEGNPFTRDPSLSTTKPYLYTEDDQYCRCVHLSER